MSQGFPFTLSDLKGWIIKRKDGTEIHYTVNRTAPQGAIQKIASTTGTTYVPANDHHYNFGDWCDHTPTKPIFTFANGSRLFVGDAPGSRKVATRMDYIIDGGAVFSDAAMEQLAGVVGDPDLVAIANAHRQFPIQALQIDWTDRQAPELAPSFWPALLAYIEAKPGDIMVSCQGGHGRSGSSAVCLMMAGSDYTAKEAIIHLRALHCPRAIESKVQHEYLGEVSAHLGRPDDHKEVEDIKDYKAAFQALAKTSPTAARYLAQLEAKTEAKPSAPPAIPSQPALPATPPPIRAL